MPSMQEEKTSPKKKRRSLIEFPTGEDRKVLGVCMGIALIFWLLVKLSGTYRTEKIVELYFSLPEGKVFSALPPKDITATIEGAGWELLFDFLQSSQISLSYDLRGVKERFVLSRGQLRSEILSRLGSRSMSIVELNYDDIVLQLEERSAKRVPVRLLQRLSFVQGYRLQNGPELVPDSVTLTGPESQLAGVGEWPTDSVVLNQLKKSVSRTVDLQAPPTGMHLSADKVKVEILVEQLSEKTFWVPVTVLHDADSVRVFPKNIQLTCTLGLSHYDNTTAGDFEITADLRGAALQKDRRNTALLQLTRRPDYADNIRFSPKSVEFFLIR